MPQTSQTPNIPQPTSNPIKSYFSSLFGNVRFYVLAFSVVLSLGIYGYYVATNPPGSSQIISKVIDAYALIAVSYLYIAMMATPLTKTFPSLPFRGLYIKARRGIGVSTFYFAFLHFCFAFFGELGGFSGLFFLSSKYLIALSLSFTALFILLLMAATSFDFMVQKLGFLRWKMLHRFVYLAGLLVLIHAVLLGSHFVDLFGLIPQILFGAVAILLFLEANRFDGYLQSKFPSLPQFGISILVVCLLILGCLLYLFLPQPNSDGTISLGIHAQHIQLAKEAQQAAAAGNQPGSSPLPSYLQGDKTKRFTVSFFHPDVIEASKDADLSFKIYDASSGNPISLFSFVYTKTMHLIIVDNELKYFTHIHPEQKDTAFHITTQFPHQGRYHVYIDFQPLGAIEQQFGFTVDVGDNPTLAHADIPADTNHTKTFGDYTVSLIYATPLKAADMSVGKDLLSFKIFDAKTGKPVTNLKPYLAAFGHLVMINEETYDYLHVHPNNLVAPAPDANGGPDVEFLPLGLYGPIKPGIYRAFAQFNPDNKLFVSDFTVKVE